MRLKWTDVNLKSKLYSVDKENLIVEVHPVFGVELLPKFGKGDILLMAKCTLLVIVRISQGVKVHVHFDLDSNSHIKDNHSEYWFSRETAEEELIIAKTSDARGVYE